MVWIILRMLGISFEWFEFAFKCLESRTNGWDLHSSTIWIGIRMLRIPFQWIEIPFECFESCSNGSNFVWTVRSCTRMLWIPFECLEFEFECSFYFHSFFMVVVLVICVIVHIPSGAVDTYLSLLLVQFSHSWLPLPPSFLLSLACISTSPAAPYSSHRLINVMQLKMEKCPQHLWSWKRNAASATQRGLV